MMKTPHQKVAGKRSRSTASTEEDDTHTDDDLRGDDPSTRPAQAERKRELERNRRNLVNIRFQELDTEIRRCAPPLESSPSTAKSEPTTKCRRIDKEAVLKEAAQRLAVQRKEIADSVTRISNMTNEIDNLRAEKVELRGDKAYLREELETLRTDIQRLRADNIHLWQALKKQTSVKNLISPDVAKIPADVFLRQKPLDHQSLPVVTNPAVISSTASIQSAISRQAPPFQSTPPTHNQQLPQHQRNTSPDSYLVFQSPEELGELFSSYVPGSLTAFERAVSLLPTNPAEQRQSPNEPPANVISQSLAAVDQLGPPQSGFNFGVSQPQSTAPKPPDISVSPSAHSNDLEKQDEDPFSSDVAYCV